MSLATKYRPSSFDDVVEQDIVVDMLKKLCESDTLSNRNFLLIGSAGIGKTTLSRIMANHLNHGLGEPIEIDAASNNGVESVRQIVQQASQYPVGCKYKVFICDECHSFSSQSWQIFLKCLEEQPARTIFIFCTTNPEKIPATILSRVQVFQLSKISLNGIFKRLMYVLTEEQAEGSDISYEPDAINFIAKLANGGMRDALTLLDKALSYSSDLSIQNVVRALNLPDYDRFFDLLSSYAKKDNASITKIVSEVYDSGVNFIRWFQSFHAFVMNIVKYIFIQDINETTIPSNYKDKISRYGPSHCIICLKLANKLIALNDELRKTQYLQEVALTYLCFVNSK